MSGQQQNGTAAAVTTDGGVIVMNGGGVGTAGTAGTSTSAIENGREGVTTTTTTNTSIPTSTPSPLQPSKAAPVEEEEPELDDFGLPVFKPVISIHLDSSDDEDEDVGRKDDEVDVSSRTTGSPVREVELELDERDGEVMVGEKILAGAVGVVTIAAGATFDGGKKEEGGEGSTVKDKVEEASATAHSKSMETPATSTPVQLAPVTVEEAPKSAKAVPETPKEVQAVPEEPKEVKKTTETLEKIKTEPLKETAKTDPPPKATSPVSPPKQEEPEPLSDINDRTNPTSPTSNPLHNRNISKSTLDASLLSPAPDTLPKITKDQKETEQPAPPTISSWSHQQSAPTEPKDEKDASRRSSGEWQEMPAYAPYDIYNDDGKLIAKEYHFSDDENEKEEEDGVGGASKGYTRVQMDEDAQSATSMDDNTGYLFKGDEDLDAERNPLSQLETTKDLLTEGQRIAYVGLCKLCMVDMRTDRKSVV